MQIEYRKITQLEQDRLAPIMARVALLAPWWCRSITVSVNSLHDAVSMCIDTVKPYGRIHIEINEGVLDALDDDELFDDLIHEIAHGYNDEIRTMLDSILHNYITSDEDKAIVNQLIERAIEFDTESLAVLFRGEGL